MGIHKRFIFACVFATRLAVAQGGPGPSGSPNQISLHIPNEMALPGGIVQMKLLVTTPTPISSGGPRFDFDSTFDAVWGIELFNPTGDVNGAAVIDGSQVSVFYTTSSGASGSDYPIMTVALHVRPEAAPGTQTQFSLDPASTWILGLLGPATLKPMAPAIVTVGGTISITNVVPGGGVLPAGSMVSIQGIGFGPKTQVQLNAIKASSIALIGPNEIQVALAETTNMTGQKIQVVNPDGSQDTYFSYLRGISLVQSARPLLQNTIPIFSSVTYSKTVYGPIGTLLPNQFSGIAVQNSNIQAASVTVSLYSAQNALLASSTLTLPSGFRLTQETSEMTTGFAPPFGSYIAVSSSEPVQSFCFIADTTQSTLFPFAATAALP